MESGNFGQKIAAASKHEPRQLSLFKKERLLTPVTVAKFRPDTILQLEEQLPLMNISRVTVLTLFSDPMTHREILNGQQEDQDRMQKSARQEELAWLVKEAGVPRFVVRLPKMWTWELDDDEFPLLQHLSQT